MPLDVHVRERMILDHLPQVELVARRFHRRCRQVELEDLIAEGTIGMITAIDRFDPALGWKSKTFVEHRIRGAILDYLRRIDPLPRSVRRFQKMRDALRATANNNELTPEVIAAHAALPVEKCRLWAAMIVASGTVSLESIPNYGSRL